jgi:hypothetical protein
MADRPNDRLRAPEAVPDELTPRIYLLVGGQKFTRPSLETYFAEPGGKGAADSACANHMVGAVVCTCNKVCTCNPQCSCQAHRDCVCESVGAVEDAPADIGAVGEAAEGAVEEESGGCSCVGYYGGGGGSYCSCVPVH